MRNTYQTYNATEWQQIMASYDRSGLNQKAFCQQEGLAMSTFSKWRKQLGLVHTRPETNTTTDSEVTFKSLLPVSTLAVATATVDNDHQPSDWDVELVLGAGMILRLRAMG